MTMRMSPEGNCPGNCGTALARADGVMPPGEAKGCTARLAAAEAADYRGTAYKADWGYDIVLLWAAAEKGCTAMDHAQVHGSTRHWGLGRIAAAAVAASGTPLSRGSTVSAACTLAMAISVCTTSCVSSGENTFKTWIRRMCLGGALS